MMGSTLMYIPGSRNRQAMEKKTWFVGNVVPVVALKSMVDHHFPHEKCHFCFIHDLQTSPNVDKVDVNNFPMKSHQETSISFRDFPWISHGFPMDFPWISKALRSVGTQQQRLSDAATTWVPGYPQ